MRRTRAGTAQWVRCLVVGLLLGVVGCRPAGPAETPWQAEGTNQVIDGHTWVVGPHLVTLAPDAAVVGVPMVGAAAKLTGARHGRASGRAAVGDRSGGTAAANRRAAKIRADHEADGSAQHKTYHPTDRRADQTGEAEAGYGTAPRP